MTSDLLLLLDDVLFTDMNVYSGSGGSVSGHFQDILVILRLKISALQIAVKLFFSKKEFREITNLFIYFLFGMKIKTCRIFCKAQTCTIICS